MANKRIPKEKKLSFFAKGVIIYAVSLAVLLGGLILLLADFLRVYENNLPEKYAEEYVSSLDEKALAGLIEACLGNISEYENGELILSNAPFLSGDITGAKLAKEYTSKRPVYRLICGGTDVGKLILRPAEKDARYGLTAWEVDSALLYPEAVPGGEDRLSVNVTLPKGATLFANGVKVSQSHVTVAPYDGECVLASYEDDCDIYTLSGLALIPTLEAEYEGEKLSLSEKNGKYDWFSQTGKTFDVSVPAGAVVTVFGKEAPAEKAKKGEGALIISPFEKELGDVLPPSESYTVSGSLDSTDIKVYIDGTELSDGKYIEEDGKKLGVSYLYSEEALYKVHAYLPEGATLLINGIEAEPSNRKANYPSLSEISKYISFSEGEYYEISGLLCPPAISAKMGEKALNVSFAENSDRVYSAEFYGKAVSQTSEMTLAAEEFTKAYFHYVANGAIGIEENYASLVEKMIAQSPAYNQIKRSKESFQFVNQATYRIDRISPEEFIPLGGGAFSCKVDFSVNLRYYRNEKQYEGVISLVFTKNDDRLSVCYMKIDSEG